MNACSRSAVLVAAIFACFLPGFHADRAQAQAHAHPAATEPAPQSPEVKAGATTAPLFATLGKVHRTVTTSSPEAQRYFDQGLELLFAFNLEEAQRSFEQAARLDEQCALCHWGVAMSFAPHINFAAQAERTVAAQQAIRRAQSAAAGATPVEQALIAALARRSSDPAPEGMAAQLALDQHYADAMREVSQKFPDDLDVAALFAEAMMNLRPWDLWTRDGQPQPGTAEIVATLERVLAKNPQHPAANHYYIHALEASPQADKALPSAERIAALSPGAAHMVHMGSHIFVKVGRYADASEVNRRAIEVDRAYLAQAGPLAIYPMYVGHNFQFLWSTSMMEGRFEEALVNARAVVAQTPLEMLQLMPGMDFLLGYPVWTLLRFGHYDEVLTEPKPAGDFPYVTATWHAARGLAMAELGEIAGAEAEAVQVVKLAASLPEDARAGLNPAKPLLELAGRMIAGRVAAQQGRLDDAVRELGAAAALEDGLAYNEPSDWYLPVRHLLGKLLLDGGRKAEAQAVYEADLARHPENGWALAGLAASLRRPDKAAELEAVQARLAKAWSQTETFGKSSWVCACGG